MCPVLDIALTLLQYFAKVLVVTGAVPATVPELVLALPDSKPGSFDHFTHYLRLSLAQLRLLPRQTLGLSANTVGVHDERTAHCPGNKEHKVRIKPTAVLVEQHL